MYDPRRRGTLEGVVTAVTGHDAEEVFYLGLALDERYVEGFVEGCLERIGEDDYSDEEDFLRHIWEEGDDLRGFVVEALEGGVEVRSGRP